MITASPARLPAVPIGVWVIAGAWALALVTQFASAGKALHHHDLAQAGVSLATVGLFLVAWQVHIAAMMLPSSMPLILLFNRAAEAQPRAALAKASFLGAYLVVWSVFGIAALLGDALIHRLADEVSWLAARPQVIAGSVLLLAGAFQFTDLKEKCLDECRRPAAFLMRGYRRGAGQAFRLGREHALFCVGCCWALMLLMFAVGIANLLWMAPMTLLMFYEKAGRWGKHLVVPVGVAFIALGVLVLARPEAMPLLGLPGIEAAAAHDHGSHSH